MQGYKASKDYFHNKGMKKVGQKKLFCTTGGGKTALNGRLADDFTGPTDGESV
jgi:hypothetical protein